MCLIIKHIWIIVVLVAVSGMLLKYSITFADWSKFLTGSEFFPPFLF